MWVAARYGNFAQAGGGAEATPGSGYTGWWRADGSDNLTDGGVVASITDRSSNANHMLQSTGAAKPLYRATGGPNSKPAVEADGSDDEMFATSDSSVHLTLSAGTVYAVFMSDSSGSNGDSVVNPTLYHFNNRVAQLWTNVPRALVRHYDGNDDLKNNGTNLSNSTWYACRIRYNGVNAFILVNGGTEQSVASGNIDSLASSPNLFSQGGTRFWNGKYADLITYNTCVSDNDATDTAARNYLSKRYALTL